MNGYVLAVVGFMLSWVMVGQVCKYAKKIGLIAHVNQRSSHAQPLPEGGGIGFVISATALGVFLAMQGSPALWLFVSLSFLIAVIGLLDDLYSLHVLVRLSIQLGVLLYLVLSLPGLPLPFFLDGAWPTKWLFVLGLVLLGVWWVNLFNFMDGIDGIASLQGLFMMLAGLSLSWLVEPVSITALENVWVLSVTGAILGFLFYNWPPAKIFMGDVGSTWLAVVIFSFALYSVQAAWLSYTIWLILAATFITDATVTLVRRMCLKLKWYEAHRNHAYQKLTRSWGCQRTVILSITAINIVWLLPLAMLSLYRPEWAVPCLLLAYVPLTLLAIKLGAGHEETADA